MDFNPPEPADLANVRALNAAFLDALNDHTLPVRLRSAAPDGLADACRDGVALKRLRRCPFLLFSLAEHDAARWDRLFRQPPRRRHDLVDAMRQASEAPRLVTFAALGFLWQLARRRPYAARVVSGASLGWCERLSVATLVDIYRFAEAEPSLIDYRNSGNAAFWRRLLLSATSAEKTVRSAARLAALQMLLTEIGTGGHGRLAAAACTMPAPLRRVADRAPVSKPVTRGYNTPPDDGAENKKPDENLRKR